MTAHPTDAQEQKAQTVTPISLDEQIRYLEHDRPPKMSGGADKIHTAAISSLRTLKQYQDAHPDTIKLAKVMELLRECNAELKQCLDFIEAEGFAAPRVLRLRARITALLSAGDNGGWMPIETAPRDGTWILAVNAQTNRDRQHVVHYSERHGKEFPWVTGSAPMDFVAGITDWQPLPTPPKNGGK